MRSFIVTKNEAGQRLDKMLSKYMNLAGKSFLYKMIRKKNITLNGKKCDGSEKLALGDEIKLFLSEETIEKFSNSPVQKVKKVKLDIIYEDTDIILVNKPSGMLSQKASPDDESLVEYLIDYLLDSKSLDREQLKSFRPSVCNRLDRNTSGIVAAGKSLAGLQVMSQVFKDRSLHKYYMCIVSGELKGSRTIEGYLKKDDRTNQVFITETEEEGSLPIKTRYQPVSTNGRHTLLSVLLITGRSHQIRAHLASIGHPIVGDYKYGRPSENQFAKEKYKITSQLLHSARLVLPELLPPFEYLGKREFYAPLPPDFQRMIRGEGLSEEKRPLRAKED